MIPVVLHDVLNEPVQDLQTAEIESERRDFVACRQSGLSLRAQILDVGEDRPNSRCVASAQELLDVRERRIDSRRGRSGAFGNSSITAESTSRNAARRT